MDADRQFIEDHADLCADGAVKKCLLVKQKGKGAEILVVPVPDAPAFVLFGAHYRHQAIEVTAHGRRIVRSMRK